MDRSKTEAIVKNRRPGGGCIAQGGHSSDGAGYGAVAVIGGILPAV